MLRREHVDFSAERYIPQIRSRSGKHAGSYPAHLSFFLTLGIFGRLYADRSPSGSHLHPFYITHTSLNTEILFFMESFNNILLGEKSDGKMS